MHYLTPLVVHNQQFLSILAIIVLKLLENNLVIVSFRLPKLVFVLVKIIVVNFPQHVLARI